MHRSQSGYTVGAAADSMDGPGFAYVFGSFRLIPSQQILLEGDARVPVGGRALDLLTALVERRGELISKQELMACAWPQNVVEEGNLKVHIAALRKALRDGPQNQRFVVTVVGRGYQFVAAVEREILLASPSPTGAHPHASHNIPGMLVRPIGRTKTIEDLLERLSRVRLLTIAGPGGIGKTTVALAIAHVMAKAKGHDVWFVSLSDLSDGSFVPHAVASALSLPLHTDDVLSTLIDGLRRRDKPQLILLDCCEHVVDAAAVFAEHLTASVPHVLVLTTSREPLHAVGEYIYRLEPLESPAGPAKMNVDEALQYSAIELFVERAIATRSDFVLSDETVPVVAEVCRRLDGIALAIELAATRLNAFGIHQLLNLLNDRFFTLGQGRRTAPDRQKTLLATFDWSHQLLPEIERVVLRRLGIFPGPFALGSAAAVVSDDTFDQVSVISAMASLVAKSMLCADLGNGAVRYRLLDTTREYARRKLADAGELDIFARRHAGHFS